MTPETLLGYVGSTGSALATPPRLHFGVYGGKSYLTYDRDAEHPNALIVDRVW